MLSPEILTAAIPQAIRSINVTGWGPKTSGKVRETYQRGNHRLLIATDRISAFDRILGVIPYRGQVLNQLSVWWFEQTNKIVRNHLISSPDPNVTLAYDAQTIPIEMIVRGYITGVTSTSLWTLYQKGERQPYGIELPDGLQKNDPLPKAIVTPTTKSSDGGHDLPLTPDAILRERIVSPELWQQMEKAALALFSHGQKVAQNAGLILVDTKYEFGLIDGELAVIDEIHTPDSSRYWTQESYKRGQPEDYSKEYLRNWFKQMGYTGEGTPPPLTPQLAVEVATRYIHVYESLTSSVFEPAESPAEARILDNIANMELL